MRKAARELKRAHDSYAQLQGTLDLERQVRGQFVYQLRHVRRTVKALEELIGDKDAGPGR
jgi:hypothetical protein